MEIGVTFGLPSALDWCSRIITSYLLMCSICSEMFALNYGTHTTKFVMETIIPSFTLGCLPTLYLKYDVVNFWVDFEHNTVRVKGVMLKISEFCCASTCLIGI